MVLLMAAIAYVILQQLIIASQGRDSLLKKAIGRDWKGKLSPVLYIRGHPGGVLAALGGARHLCLSRPDLADPGSAHRENAVEPGEMTRGDPGLNLGLPL